MRLPITSFSLIAEALLGDFQAASARSPTSYPWCSRSGRSSANNCYFTSKEQCQRTISGIGAFCLKTHTIGLHLGAAPGPDDPARSLDAFGVSHRGGRVGPASAPLSHQPGPIGSARLSTICYRLIVLFTCRGSFGEPCGCWGQMARQCAGCRGPKNVDPGRRALTG
jgi:hypothetical protein